MPYSSRGRKSVTDSREMFKVMAYGYQNWIYSSRKLEEACEYRVDFIWLLENGKALDHATISRFHTGRCAKAVEELFNQYMGSFFALLFGNRHRRVLRSACRRLAGVWRMQTKEVFRFPNGVNAENHRKYVPPCWDERNGGNISYLLKESEVAEYIDLNNVIRNIPLGFDAAPIIGKIFLITGTGKDFKNVDADPETNLGSVRIAPDGKTAELRWGHSDGGRVTSEFLPT